MNITDPSLLGDACPIINFNDFDIGMLGDLTKTQPRPRGNNGVKNPRSYIDLVTAFDIETSRLPGTDDAFCYLWQYQIDERITIIGRYLEDAISLFHKIAQAILSDKVSLVILVHNLSYEFHFLQGLYPFTSSEVFAIDSRKVAKCTMYDKRLEFRCTYIHSNMSLSMYCQKMNTKHRKLDGDVFDYHKVRYPWTPLTDYEIAYGQNDVLSLVEAYKADMRRDHDSLSTIPMTNTGYVRRECKRAMRMWSRPAVKRAQPDEHLYALLRAAFRGGDVHANRYYVGHILHDVKSADRSSSYPDVMCNDQFPIAPFRPMRETTVRAMEKYLQNSRAMLLKIRFTRMRMRDPYYGFPYLAFHKSRIHGQYCLDNGRILWADQLETTITDIDYKIVLKVYTWDKIEILDGMYSAYQNLPSPLVLTIQSYYRAKTELKGVEGKEDFYTKAKNQLNSTYGMMVECPARQNIIYDRDDPFRFSEGKETIEALLAKNYARAWLCYQWGVWVTAHARYRLFEAIQLAGEHAVYCDTDSVKYIGTVDFDAYNRARVSASKQSGSYAADPAGTIHYMGVMEQEKTYLRFVTHGAKKYAYEYDDGKPHVTISGVNKRKGAAELRSHGGLEVLQPGFIFRVAGGTESVYNDNSDYGVTIDGHSLHIRSNICIKDSTYTLSYAPDYDKLLHDPALLRKIKESYGDYLHGNNTI